MARGEERAAGAAQGLMGDGARGERTGGTYQFVEYSILIAYRFLISESFGVNRTHNFHSYCSLGFVNCHPTGGIKSKLKALTIDSI